MGFSLIEIFIILVIISILIGLAFPIYSKNFVRSNRIEAVQTLLALAVAMEKYYLQFDTYENATLNDLHFSRLIARNNYTLTINLLNTLEYELIATPLGTQAENDLGCESLILKSNGEKAITGSGEIADCW